MKHVLQTMRGVASSHQRPAHAGGALEKLRDRLGLVNTVSLLLIWDVSGLSAALCRTQSGRDDILAEASSRQPEFGAAVNEVLSELGRRSPIKPRRVALTTRFLLPAVLSDLPVTPDKPRRPEQMRELLQADLEPIVAEFGSLWLLGALLQARGFINAEDRQRITLEESVRRQQRAGQLRFGEIAMELDLIDRAALDECLDLQSSLQHLDTRMAAGWHGRIENKQPIWLVCGVNHSSFDNWSEVLRERGLKLSAALPLAWLASAPNVSEKGSDERRESYAVDIELHSEELVAVQRRNGLVLATRSEGRGERKPTAEWLYRLIADWAGEPRVDIRLHALNVEDDAVVPDLAEALALRANHPCQARLSADARQAIWQNLPREASVIVSTLPRIVPKELRGNLLNNPDARRLLALGGVILVLMAVEGVQRYRLAGLEHKMADLQAAEKKRAATTQLTSQANQKLVELAKDLDKARRELEPMLGERSRLVRIGAMRRDLPDLMFQLAQAVGSDAVIEGIHNDSMQSRAPAIQVIAWSPSYTGAQDFVNRMALLARDKGYGVAQMEIKERRGRDNRSGHEVKFWLLLEENELEGNEAPTPGASAVSAAPASPNSGGISSQTTTPAGKP